MEVFLWIFHGETTREKSTCGGKHPIFMLPAAKSRWLIFKKIMGLLTFARSHNYTKNMTLSNYSAVMLAVLSEVLSNKGKLFLCGVSRQKQAAPKAGANSTSRANQRLFSFRTRANQLLAQFGPEYHIAVQTLQR